MSNVVVLDTTTYIDKPDEFEERINDILTVAEDTDTTNLPAIKTSLVSIRKFDKEVQLQRKLFKEKCLEPYYAVEDMLKERLEPVHNEIERLSTEQKEIEIAEKSGKRNDIIEIINDTKEFLDITFELDNNLLIKPEYMNKGWTIKKITQDIEEIVAEVKDNYENLDDDIKMFYLEHLDLSKALKQKRELQDRIKQLEEIKKENPSEVEHIENVMEDVRDSVTIVVERKDLEKLDKLEIEYKIKGEL